MSFGDPKLQPTARSAQGPQAQSQTQPQSKKEPNQNLTGALRASLALIEGGGDQNLGEGFEGQAATSPLAEASPDSVDLFFDRINQHLFEGFPERITDSEIARLTDVFRAQALRWEQEESQPKERKSRGKAKTHAEAIDVDL